MISFFVPGIPAPQGSKRVFVVAGKARLVESSAACKPWRADVRAAALEAMQGRPLLEGPLRMDVTFAMPRPASVPKDRRGWPATKPDRDKLLRAVGDALTAAVYRDDSQVCAGSTRKEYVGVTEATCGARVIVEALICRHASGTNKRGRCYDCGEEVVP